MNDEPHSESLLHLWFETSRSLDRILVDVLSRLGIGETTGGVLWALDEAGEPPTVRELARLLGCDPSNASLVSTQMEEAGLLERRPHPHDGRARVLVLTERGAELRQQLMRDLLAVMPWDAMDVEQRRQLVHQLKMIQRAVGDAHRHPKPL